MKGVVVPILTIIDQDERIDEARMRSHVDYVIEGGVSVLQPMFLKPTCKELYNHFKVFGGKDTLLYASMCHGAVGGVCAAAIPGKMNGIGTHWIWQEGRERLTREPMRIVGGCIDLPQKGGLGVEVDREQVMKAHKLYMDNCLGARDDSISMQYLIPGWTFDHKKPCLVR